MNNEHCHSKIQIPEIVTIWQRTKRNNKTHPQREAFKLTREKIHDTNEPIAFHFRMVHA